MGAADNADLYALTAALLILLLGIGQQAAPRVIGRLTIHERVVIRVPVTPSTPIRWKEKKGPRCIPATQIGAAAARASDQVDFILRGGLRIRAHLEQACPALDFYSGFYLRPGPDGQICRERDAVHSRSGGECTISRFRTLVPVAGK